MKSAFAMTLSALLLGGAAIAQDAEISPNPGIGTPKPESTQYVDCFRIMPEFNITGSTGDVGVLGLAHADNVGKWFFSGRATAPNFVVYIYDEDDIGGPDPATLRTIPKAPGMVSAAWGHRDGEWDRVGPAGTGGMVYFGDENRNIFELDPTTETWTNRSWNLAGSAVATQRGVAVWTDNLPNPGDLQAFTCDWGNNIEEWDLPAAGGAGVLINASITNPGSTYGLSYFDSDNDGTLDALAVHGQIQYSNCVGTGLTEINVIDPVTTNILWTRAGDLMIAGPSPNVNGGIAGGLQETTVGGQQVFALVEQANNDSAGFVPYQGWSAIGSADCGATLNHDGSPAIGGTTGFAIVGGNVAGASLVLLAPPPAVGLPLTPGCILDANIATSTSIVVPHAVGTTGRVIPIPGSLAPFEGTQIIGDTIEWDGSTGILSSNTITITLVRRCW